MLKLISKISLILIVAFSLTGISSVSASASQSDCPTCENGPPTSTGSKENINKAKETLYYSSEFNDVTENLSIEFNSDDLIITAMENEDSTDSMNYAVATLSTIEAEDNLNNIMFTINLNTEEITDIRKTFVEVVDDNNADITIEQNGEIISDITLSTDKIIDNLTSSEITYEEFTEIKEDTNNVQPFGACEDILNVLMGAGVTGVQCYLLCLEL